MNRKYELYNIGVSKKTKKPIKPRKPEKNNWKDQIVKKKPIKPIRILKKPTGSVPVLQVWNRTEQNEPNQKKPSQNWKNRAKTEKTESNQFQPVFVLKNRTEPNRNRSVWTGFGFLKKKNGSIIFFVKNWTEQKIIIPIYDSWCTIDYEKWWLKWIINQENKDSSYCFTRSSIQNKIL
jgi:hypothetical protein